jgi:aldehyde dehydrogenase (NAD+)
MTATKDFKMLVGGNWVSANGTTFPDYNPATGEVWAEIPDASRDVARSAIEAASAAFNGWKDRPYTERAAYFLKAADILEKRTPDFAAIMSAEGGSWFGKCMFEAGYVAGMLRAAAAITYQPTGEILPSDHAKVNMIVRVPLGVVSVISPWNFPLILSMRGAAFAMALGNTVVLKPSEETPVAGGLFLAELFEEAGLPEGVLNVVTCSRENVEAVGDELVTHPLVRGVSFTGSTAVGRQVAAKAASHLKRFAMELGGKDALIVLDDADMDRAVDCAVFGTFMHQGQICMSVERLIVDESLADEFTERLVERVKGLKVGSPDDKGNIIGPIINQRQLDKISSQVDEAVAQGAKVLVGGKHEGLFYHPTVLTNIDPKMRIFQEETFGPVAPIVRVKSEEEAIAVANDCEYGLAAGIITKNEERGLRVAHRLETGIAHVNDTSVYDEPIVPFGGVKSSGFGRHGGRGAIESFTETRWLTLERGGRHFPF